MILRSDETATVHGLVAGGVASAILPSLAVDRHDDRVHVIPIGHLLPPRRIGLIWHRDRHHSTAFRDFLALARRGLRGAGRDPELGGGRLAGDRPCGSWAGRRP